MSDDHLSLSLCSFLFGWSWDGLFVRRPILNPLCVMRNFPPKARVAFATENVVLNARMRDLANEQAQPVMRSATMRDTPRN